VCLSVTDDGQGLPPELVKRVFEPFFTTKDVGKGTGLGLSISMGIIEDHHGTINLSSAVGRGTTFTVKLPS
jgi:signal transduction histidine kinase